MIATFHCDDAFDTVDPFRLKQQEAREAMTQSQLIEGLDKPKTKRNEITLLMAKMRAGGSRRGRACEFSCMQIAKVAWALVEELVQRRFLTGIRVEYHW